MSINGKRKGKAGELEFAKFCRERLGIGARRGQQYNGLDGEDVKVDVPNLHIEVKRVEKLNVAEAMKQAERDAGVNVPVVAHRRNRHPWLLTIKAENLRMFVEIIADYYANEAKTRSGDEPLRKEPK
jgi:hypothetical protein